MTVDAFSWNCRTLRKYKERMAKKEAFIAFHRQRNIARVYKKRLKKLTLRYAHHNLVDMGHLLLKAASP